MTATGFGYKHFVSLCMSCACSTWFLSLTNKVDNQFCVVFFSTLQSPNCYHSSISIVDSRKRSVYIVFTIKNNITIETSISSQVGKNSRPYFQCVHHPLVPRKLHQRHWHSSKFSYWYWQLVYRHRQVFQFFWNFFEFCTMDTLWQKTDKLHDTVSKSGSYHYRLCGCQWMWRVLAITHAPNFWRIFQNAVSFQQRKGSEDINECSPQQICRAESFRLSIGLLWKLVRAENSGFRIWFQKERHGKESFMPHPKDESCRFAMTKSSMCWPCIKNVGVVYCHILSSWPTVSL